MHDAIHGKSLDPGRGKIIAPAAAWEWLEEWHQVKHGNQPGQKSSPSVADEEAKDIKDGVSMGLRLLDREDAAPTWSEGGWGGVGLCE
ncbi:hypothetical protein NDU88_001682 [Pleurodeles waltl]|uniref:Uncharacterized protein n=1 Tax=Pleurodeles waltl TaxID=8319 RepID=A0AAV7W0Z1_PLEWA|nr:hypothetical protein NDU88_001682 [Pleurodeles waltl]